MRDTVMEFIAAMRAEGFTECRIALGDDGAYLVHLEARTHSMTLTPSIPYPEGLGRIVFPLSPPTT